MTIWFKSPTNESFNSALTNSLASHIGIKITYVGEDFLVGSMPVAQHTSQGSGLLHGGASLTLAETLGVLGANACVDQNTHQCLCMDINANHISSVNSGSVTAMARPVHQGKQSQVWRVEIRDEEDELVCESRVTISVVAL